MSRRQRKKEAARFAAKALAAPPPAPKVDSTPVIERLLAANGLVERIANGPVGKGRVLRLMAGTIARLCATGDPFVAEHFFRCLGSAFAKAPELGCDVELYRRCEVALGLAFYGPLLTRRALAVVLRSGAGGSSDEPGN